MRSLVLIQTENQKILSSSLSALAAAKKLGGIIDAFFLGEDSKTLISDLKGISKAYLAPNHLLEGQIAEILKNLSSDYTHFFAAGTSEGKNILPRLAGLLDIQPITEITDILSENTFVRPVYAGTALAKVQTKDEKKILLIRSASFEPDNSHKNAETPECVMISEENLSPYPVTFIANENTPSDKVDLETAKIIVSGGKGFKSAESFATLLEPLAKILEAGIGASRAAVDSDFAPNESQVGQTGKIVAPDIYIAIGLSGAPQHLAGIKDSKVIFAINLDPQASIFNNADYGLEADLFEVLPELTAELEKLS
ncbi:electron transfer flavoprotein subunit alpha/FixB family protein [Acetobacteraceae bacterium]|nr:electron transfer flavoprotein subunit alpha/FixB family protein [Acetobacteraceae bacterium]